LKSKKYFLFAISVVFIVFISTSSSAFETKIYQENTKYEIEDLKFQIKEKIKELSFADIIKGAFTNKLAIDPNGPYQGGLDDSSDYSALFWGLAGFVFVSFPLPFLLNPDNFLQLIGGFFGTFTASFNIIMNLGEAFDLIEYVADGC